MKGFVTWFITFTAASATAGVAQHLSALILASTPVETVAPIVVSVRRALDTVQILPEPFFASAIAAEVGLEEK